MKVEIVSLFKNKTLEFVDKPKDHKLVTCKWIYKVKDPLSRSDKLRFKAIQRSIFSPIVKHTSIRIILSVTTILDLELE